jgi:hypothetical protein
MYLGGGSPKLGTGHNPGLRAGIAETHSPILNTKELQNCCHFISHNVTGVTI